MKIGIKIEISKYNNERSVSPGIGISLIAETNQGFFFSSDECIDQFESKGGIDYEKIADLSCLKLLDELHYVQNINIVWSC
jgi:RNA 3'-terminal phosphate cyclase (RTC), insert domain